MKAGHTPSPDFWNGKRVLITGHTGFKGAWLSMWLSRLGAHVTGVSLPPNKQPNLFDLARIDEITVSHFCDVKEGRALKKLVTEVRPEAVFHLAAQALVRAGYNDPVDTFAVNVMGTVNLLDILRHIDSVRVVVSATSDKVYRNLELPYPYREDDALGGHDPYSASKAAAEIVIASYRDAFLNARGIAVASARAGNVIGGGDWCDDRLIPDAIRAWDQGGLLRIRRPQAIRPWQHVLEPLAGYLKLAEKCWHQPELAGAYNFGPYTHEAATVRDVVEIARQAYGRGEVAWGDGNEGPHEAGWLALETAKARTRLNVSPRWNLGASISRTMDWYRQLAGGASARALCEADVSDYETTP